jgi:hypothetical protein
MRPAIDIGFHGRDMTEMVFASLKSKQRGRDDRAVWNAACEVSDAAEQISQAQDAGETHQSAKCDTPTRLLETAFHGNSR